MDNGVKHLLEFGEFRIDPEQRSLFRGDDPIPLSPKAFDLLLALIERSGRVVLKDDLMKILWPDTFVEESNLGQHISQLRKALGERAQGSSYIVTVPGRGYRFTQVVRALPREEENIIIASRSRSRLTIEQKDIPDHYESSDPQRAFTNPGAIRALSGRVSEKWRPIQIAATLMGAALIGGFGFWLLIRPTAFPDVLRTVQVTHLGRVEPFSRALSDGSRVYFEERLGGTWQLLQVPEPGGEPRSISTSVLNVGLFDIDRRRSQFLAASQGPDGEADSLWAFSTAGGSGRRIGDVRADDAAWSPDSSRIAYAREYELFVIHDDGTDPQRRFSAPGVIEFLRWSPDGARLSFTVRDSYGHRSLWEIGADGHDPRRLPIGPTDPVLGWGDGECCGDWSPDGNYFVFHSSRTGTETLWLMRANKSWFGDSVPIRLYSSPDRINQPRFTADGKKILFVNSQERRELVRYDSAKGLFVPYLRGIPARHLSFSRDEQWVAYKDQRDNSLWRSRIDGSDALQLTFPPLDAYHSTWSPDGQKIIFEGSGKIYMISFAGGKPEPLLAGDGWGGQPSLSPDGKSLLFSRSVTGVPENIAMLDLTTRQAVPIPGSHEYECPQWSPDGKHAVASDKKDRKLMLYDFTTRVWSELADGLPYGWGLRWSSDSRYVYYQHAYGIEEQPIFRVRVGDRRIEQVTSSRQILRADVLSYSMTGLTPDNSPLASLVHQDSDVFALELDVP